MSPSGLGSRVRAVGGLTPIDLGVATAERYTGLQSAIPVTGVGFPADVAIVAARALTPTTWVIQATTRLSATSLEFDLARENLWDVGNVQVRAWSPTAGFLSFPSSFAVTHDPDLEHEEDPMRGLVVDGGGALVTLADQSPYGRTLTPAVGQAPVRAVANVNGRDSLAFADSNKIMRNVALGVALGPMSAITVYRLIKSSVASAANSGVYGLHVHDGTAAHDYLLGGNSGLVAGETWVCGAGGTARQGTNNLTWAANEVWLEEWTVTAAVSCALTKNGTPVVLNLSNAGGANMAPSSAAPYAPATVACEFMGAAGGGASTGWRAYGQIYRTVKSVAKRAEIRAHLGSLGGIVVT